MAISDDERAALIEAATSAREKAYARYSNFDVGAALLAEDGQVYRGCNVENAAYPLGMCAEANAIGAMVLAGGKRIKAIVIAGKGDIPCTPCGGCRQKINEFGDGDTQIIVVNEDGQQMLDDLTIAALLPHGFGPENL